MADVMVHPELTSPFHDVLRSIGPAAPLTVDILVNALQPSLGTF